jgi:hypothetical protein
MWWPTKVTERPLHKVPELYGRSATLVIDPAPGKGFITMSSYYAADMPSRLQLSDDGQTCSIQLGDAEGRARLAARAGGVSEYLGRLSAPAGERFISVSIYDERKLSASKRAVGCCHLVRVWVGEPNKVGGRRKPFSAMYVTQAAYDMCAFGGSGGRLGGARPWRSVGCARLRACSVTDSSPSLPTGSKKKDD